MPSQQWERGQVVIESDVRGPCHFAMAGGAPGGKLSAMHIILLMAARTIIGQRRFQRSAMTTLAGQCLVSTVQRKTRFYRVVKSDAGPVLDVVAASAVCAVIARVHIIVLVAAMTINPRKIRQLDATVARLAGESGVAPRQSESGFRQMIKPGRAPLHGVVTVVTGRAIEPIVNVLIPMAVNTLIGRLPVGLPPVASGAGGQLVCTE